MSIFSRIEKSPLHRAVIADDSSAVEELISHKELLYEVDSLGFTAYELAQFLQRKEILKLLNPNEPNIRIKILLPDEEEFRYFEEEDFFSSLGLHYLKTLHFASYKALKASINKSRWNWKSLFIHRESYSLGRQYQDLFLKGSIANLSIRWIDNMLGYGVFAESAIDEGAFAGEYTGLVRQISRWRGDHNAYCFHYPGKCCSLKLFVVDALHEGNILRFVNHSDIPNLKPLCMVDRGMTHIAFMATRPIAIDEQLTIDYGENYWKERIKKQV